MYGCNCCGCWILIYSSGGCSFVVFCFFVCWVSEIVVGCSVCTVSEMVVLVVVWVPWSLVGGRHFCVLFCVQFVLGQEGILIFLGVRVLGV